MSETQIPNIPENNPRQFHVIDDPRLTGRQADTLFGHFLQHNENVNSWHKNIAQNIAYAELLYHPLKERWGIFNGIRVLKKANNNLPVLNKSADAYEVSFHSTYFFHHGIASAYERDTNLQRFLSNCSRTIHNIPEAQELVKKWETEFFNLLSSWKFLPNAPLLKNAGQALQQLAACYVIPIKDSMESITEALQAQALINKTSAATGFSFAELRPGGSQVQLNKGSAAGVAGFLTVFDKMAQVIFHGKNNPNANLAMLPYWHPDIKQFLDLKSAPDGLVSFTLAVAVDAAFMQAVKDDEMIPILNPRTKDPMRRINARELFDYIAEKIAHSDRINIIFSDRLLNATPEGGDMTAVNPVGELPLQAYESAQLGYLNMPKFISEKSKDGIDWTDLKAVIHTAVRFMDNAIDINNYPVAESELISKGNRRLGLGITGWGEMLEKLEIPYESQKALDLASKLMKFIQDTAQSESEDLAKHRGPFPNWKNSIYDPAGPHFEGTLKYFRHCALTTIAPSGELIDLAALSTSGIEPAPNTTVSIAFQLKLQKTFQDYTDNMCSKTLFVEKKIGPVGIKNIITQAYEAGCRAVKIKLCNYAKIGDANRVDPKN